MIDEIERIKKEAIETIKSILGNFNWSTDYEISVYVENQMEEILMHMALSKDYNNGVKQYYSCELSAVYLKLKETYKIFERSRWILNTFNAMKL